MDFFDSIDQLAELLRTPIYPASIRRSLKRCGRVFAVLDGSILRNAVTYLVALTLAQMPFDAESNAGLRNDNNNRCSGFRSKRERRARNMSQRHNKPACQSTQQRQPQRIGAASLILWGLLSVVSTCRRPHLSTGTSRCALPPFHLGGQKARQDLAGSQCRCRWLIS